MIIRTKGKPSRVPIRECKLAIKYAASQLLSTKMQSNLEILLRFDEEDFLAEKGWDGYCDWLDCNLKPRQFLISARPGLYRSLMMRLQLHEMVHVRQFATGQLKDFRRSDGVAWMGKLHKDTRGDKTSSPWEQEALSLEKKLYRKFMKEQFGNPV